MRVVARVCPRGRTHVVRPRVSLAAGGRAALASPPLPNAFCACVLDGRAQNRSLFADSSRPPTRPAGLRHTCLVSVMTMGIHVALAVSGVLLMSTIAIFIGIVMVVVRKH